MSENNNNVEVRTLQPMGDAISNPAFIQMTKFRTNIVQLMQLKPAIVMALSVTVVTGFSNLVMSLLRNGVPSRIRIIVQLGWLKRMRRIVPRSRSSGMGSPSRRTASIWK